MKSVYAIEIENLWKKYRLGEKQSSDMLRDILANPFKSDTKKSKDEFWALKDINLKVKEGEVLGIIGKNGSGKSTLLKILSRITPPTRGEIRMNGRVASLLEVGTGFSGELTGRENVFLNGSILGMSRSEIKRKFDEIVDFSGVEKFIDTPVKRYSSGMYVRLAFAVAAHLESEILIVDEVLAVGDAEFQKKSLGRMKNAAQSGRTVLFVSHHLDSIAKICNSAVELRLGKVVQIGNSNQIVDSYLNNQSKKDSIDLIELEGPLSDSIKINDVTINSSKVFSVDSDTDINVNFELSATDLIPDFKTTMSLYRDDIRVLTVHDVESPKDLKPGKYNIGFKIPKNLLRPGILTFGVGGFSTEKNWVYCRNAFSFTVKEKWNKHFIKENIGLINLDLETWRKST